MSQSDKECLRVPIRIVDKVKWGALAFLVHGATEAVDVIGEKADLIDNNFSFAGGHRVRKYRFKKNVHFSISTGMTLNIEQVPPAGTPQRRTQR